MLMCHIASSRRLPETPRVSRELKENNVTLHRIHTRLAKRERSELDDDLTPHLGKVCLEKDGEET